VDTTWGTTVPMTTVITSITAMMENTRHRGRFIFSADFPLQRLSIFSSKAFMGMFRTNAMIPPTRKGEAMPSKKASPWKTFSLYMIASTGQNHQVTNLPDFFSAEFHARAPLSSE
jgi:hypothetical protein